MAGNRLLVEIWAVNPMPLRFQMEIRNILLEARGKAILAVKY
jgi:hypothetical protein